MNTAIFADHASNVFAAKGSVGIGWQKRRAGGGASGQLGVAAKLNVSAPILRPFDLNLTVSGEAGGKGAIDELGISGKAQFATEASIIKDGAFSGSGFQDKSASALPSPKPVPNLALVIA